MVASKRIGISFQVISFWLLPPEGTPPEFRVFTYLLFIISYLVSLVADVFLSLSIPQLSFEKLFC